MNYFSTIFLLLNAMIFIQCEVESRSEVKSQTQLSYLALGDSYTIGEGVQPGERWPNQLVRHLQDNDIWFTEPRIIARTGWTTDELAAQIKKEAIDSSFNLVSLLIGVNNQYRGRSAENYRKEFEALLVDAIRFARQQPDHVIVISIPDYGVTPFAANRNPDRISAEIDAYNAINRQISTAHSVRYVDITPLSRQAQTDTTLLADDQLHPSAKMYSGWVDLIRPVVISLFDTSDE